MKNVALPELWPLPPIEGSVSAFKNPGWQPHSIRLFDHLVSACSLQVLQSRIHTHSWMPWHSEQSHRLMMSVLTPQLQLLATYSFRYGDVTWHTITNWSWICVQVVATLRTGATSQLSQTWKMTCYVGKLFPSFFHAHPSIHPTFHSKTVSNIRMGAQLDTSTNLAIQSDI